MARTPQLKSTTPKSTPTKRRKRKRPPRFTPGPLYPLATDYRPPPSAPLKPASWRSVKLEGKKNAGTAGLYRWLAMNTRLYAELRIAQEEFALAPRNKTVRSLAAKVESIVADHGGNKLARLVEVGREMRAALDRCEVGVAGRLYEGVRDVVGVYWEEDTFEPRGVTPEREEEESEESEGGKTYIDNDDDDDDDEDDLSDDVSSESSEDSSDGDDNDGIDGDDEH